MHIRTLFSNFATAAEGSWLRRGATSERRLVRYLQYFGCERSDSSPRRSLSLTRIVVYHTADSVGLEM